MILLLGASGSFGSAFARELRRRGHSFIPLTRGAFDYTRFDYLFDYLRTMKPEFLINAAGFSGGSDEDGLESTREMAMVANALLPQMIARVCLMTKTPWGHVSSGSVYCGAKIQRGGTAIIERDLCRAGIRELFETTPDVFHGFTEEDEPNFSFRAPPCSFHSGTKALAEEAIRDIGQSYIWRPRLAFSERDETCSYLAQLHHQTRLPDTIDSLSHIDDCVRACLDLWELGAPFGIYNVTNPGAVSMHQLAAMMQRSIKMPRPFDFMPWVEEPARAGGKRPQSHCILDVSKLLSFGVKIRPLQEALEDSLQKARLAARSGKAPEGPSTRPPGLQG